MQLVFGVNTFTTGNICADDFVLRRQQEGVWIGQGVLGTGHLVGAVQRLLSGASDPHNLIVNGGGEEGTLGSQATGWTFGNGASFLAVAEDEVHSGTRSLKIANGSASDSFSYQVTGSGTLRLYCQLGYTRAQSGTAWFDDVVVHRLYRTRTEDIDAAAVATLYAASGNTGTFGAETVICTTSIGGTFQTGFTSVYGRANCTTIPTGVVAVVRVRRSTILGVVVAMGTFSNTTGGNISIEIFASGEDANPPFSGSYVLTVQGVGGTSPSTPR